MKQRLPITHRVCDAEEKRQQRGADVSPLMRGGSRAVARHERTRRPLPHCHYVRGVPSSKSHSQH